MSAIKPREKKNSQVKTIVIIAGILFLAGGSLFAYLMFYTAPETSIEMVKIIAVTESGCIGETLDGYSVNVGDCDVQSGQYIDALVDQKVKDRTAAMNP